MIILSQLGVYFFAAAGWSAAVLAALIARRVHRRGTARFLEMSAQARHRLAEMTHRRADLQSLVDTLPDPVVLTESTGRIVVMNGPAAQLLQVQSAQALGTRATHAINEPAILEAMEAVRAEQSAPVAREVRLSRYGQRITYHALATHAKTGGVLLVLRNISALAEMVQMKTDFVANASHELRTPIAAIKAAFETLEEIFADDPDQTRQCIAIISGHLRRLEELLTDLLELSRVESPELRPQRARIDIAEFFLSLRAAMNPMAENKGVTLSFSPISEAGASIESDPRLLQLIAKNLVENSIKFTASGGNVQVCVALRSDGFKLSVTDTGIGIPPEHHARIFERFYQVNSARTGGAGRGTGLGLAIVKHAVHALNGEVEVQSVPNEGTTITCRFSAQ